MWCAAHGGIGEQLGGGGLDELDWHECQRCLAGDAEAGGRLLKRYESDIARQMWRFTRDRAVQIELVQEVFVQAYLSLRRYSPRKTPFLHWLRRIATRVGYQFWKREARRKRHAPLDGIDIAGPVAVASDAAAAALLHELLGQLCPSDRLVLTLVYFEECSMKEIADRAGWNVAMVKMRAMRARRRLRELIERHPASEALMEMAHGTA